MRRVDLLSLAVSLLFTTGLTHGCAEPERSDSRETNGAPRIDSTTVQAPSFDIQSVTLDARHRPDSIELVHLRDLGVTHITLVPFGWQEAEDAPDIRLDTSGSWYSETDAGIRTIARQAEALGMGVILKPHIWVGDYDEKQDRSQIGFDAEHQWRKWEAQYRRFLLHYARLATEIEADVLVLGTELRRSSTTRPAFWRQLAADIRTLYEGNLTYAANWHDEYERIAFWDGLDYVGVQAYFPLADSKNPPMDSLRAGWRHHQEALARLHARTDRPVLFTEIGYRSASSTASAPWRWPEQEREATAVDSLLQAQCYRAFLSTVGRAPWLAGAIIWKWHSEAESNRPTGFTPQGKPAERVLRRWFSGS